MKHTIIKKIVLSTLFISFTAIADDTSSPFSYNGIAIPDQTMQTFLFSDDPISFFYDQSLDSNTSKIDLAQCCTAPQEDESDSDERTDEDIIECDDSFSWYYVGTMHDNIHIVRAELHPSGLRSLFHSLYSIKQDGSVFKIIDVIYGDVDEDYPLQKVCITNNTISYCEQIREKDCLPMLVKLFPDQLQTLYNHSAKTGLNWENNNYKGTFTYNIAVSEDGTFQDKKIVSFKNNDKSVYSYENFPALGLTLLQEIDAHIPEELKENGIAYSPICFQKLVENDLANISTEPTSITITEHKKSPYDPEDNEFTWEYIGSLNDFHLICANDSWHTSGIYTIKKEGDTLKKIARIAWGHYENSNDNTSINPYKSQQCSWENKEQKLYKIKNNCYKYEQQANCTQFIAQLLEQFPELQSNAHNKNIVSNNTDNDITTVLSVELSSDGTACNRHIVTFYYRGAICDEKWDDNFLTQTVPLDKALRYAVTAHCREHEDRYPHYFKQHELKVLLENTLRLTEETTNQN